MMDGVQVSSRGECPRRDVMQTPDEVAAMLRLKGLGWGIKRIAKELGCSHMGSALCRAGRLGAVSRRPSAACLGRA